MAAVAAGHRETAQACAETLRAGGNAFDAVLSGYFVACVAEPVLNSLAGGGFLMAAVAGEKPKLVDFFCQTPRSKLEQGTGFYAIEGNFGDDVQEFHVGIGACAVPGAVAGIHDIHRDFCRMPLPTIAEQGISLASTGVVLNDFQAYICQILEPILSAEDAIRSLYHTKSGLKKSGDLFQSEKLSDAMEAVCREGPGLFYEGEIGQSLIGVSKQYGGHLQMRDLQAYRVQHRQPMRFDFRDASVWTNPVPSLGGSLFAHGLLLLDRSWGMSIDRYPALLAHILKASSIARATSELDLTPDQKTIDGLLDSEHLCAAAAALRTHHLAEKGTTHISVVDDDGNFAAMTLSNGEGNIHTIPGTDIVLNNMLGEEDLSPLGLGQWTPDRRLSSMMAPSLMSHNAVSYALGSGGSNRIRSALLQTIANIAGFGHSLDKAIHLPRMHYEKGILHLEPGIEPRQFDGIADEFDVIKPWSSENLFFGGVHAVSRDNKGHCHAAADQRRGGVSMDSI